MALFQFWDGAFFLAKILLCYQNSDTAQGEGDLPWRQSLSKTNAGQLLSTPATQKLAKKKLSMTRSITRLLNAKNIGLNFLGSVVLAVLLARVAAT